jgi:hypothetical protein
MSAEVASNGGVGAAAVVAENGKSKSSSDKPRRRYYLFIITLFHWIEFIIQLTFLFCVISYVCVCMNMTNDRLDVSK